jgi:hypothetical protein
MTSVNNDIQDCIKRIENQYFNNLTLIITPDLMKEINSVYEKTSGCCFANWINHRLYIIAMTNAILENKEYPDYMDWEDLDWDTANDDDDN